MKHEDDLMDALLKEQARNRTADEALLARIDKALDPEPAARTGRPAWRAALPLSAAAAVALGGAWWYHDHRQEDVVIARHDAAPEVMVNYSTGPVDALDAPPAPPPADLKAEAKPMAQEYLFVPEAREESARREEVGDAAAEPGAAGATLLREEADEARELANKRYSAPNEAPSSSMGRVIPAPRPPALAPQGGEGGGGGLDGRAGDGELRRRATIEPSRENYGRLVDQPWKSPWQAPLSTFSVDVDNAAYTNLRRMIRDGVAIQPDAVRIEECVNYFDYQYAPPAGDNAFAAHTLLATCPWQPRHLLARVAIKGREIENHARPASNLVFLIDVSGSMQSPDKLPMLKESMRTLIDSLDERDRVGIVVYAGTEGVVLEPTALDERGKSAAIAALAKLEAGGSTNGGAGLARAYRMALAHKVDGGVNRVILATDGDFNVGTTGQGQLVDLVKAEAAKGVSLSVLGFGTGNLNDAMLEAVTNDGNGNYFYIDGAQEAKRIFMQKLTGTLVTIAKDVKIQIEFNPGRVKAYRLIGYANRVLRDEDFNNDKVDAGDIGAGHTVTAFYEIVPVGVEGPDTGVVDPLRYQRPEGAGEPVPSEDWFTLKLRYKHPEGDTSRLIEAPVTGEAVAWEEAGNDFRTAAAVALFGMKLRGQPEAADISWDRITEIVRPALAEDPREQRAEFVELLQTLRGR